MKLGLKILSLTLLGLAALCWSPLQIDAARIDPALRGKLAEAGVETRIPVIVRMRDPVALQTLAVPPRQAGQARRQKRAAMIRTMQARAEQSRQPLQAVLQRHGIRQPRPLWLINGLAFEATPALIEEIVRMPQVASIRVDQLIEAPRVETAQVSGPTEPNLDLLNAPAVWARGYAGEGVTVAIMDSGVDVDHPDLGPRWRSGNSGWFNAVAENCSNAMVTCATPCDTNTSTPCDYVDADGVAHGTGVAGLILGGDAGGSVIGVAPAAQWIAVKIFDSADNAPASVIHQGFEWLLDPDGNPETDDAPDIVSNSWGFESEPDRCDSFGRVFQPDVQALKAAGIAVVFSAGNTGPDQPSSVAPANYPESFAVGSVGSFDSATEISRFSSRGPSACDGSIYPAVVAPGSAPHPAFGLKTTDYSFGGTADEPYIHLAGTSFATAHASGAMALLLSAFPDLSVGAVETALRQSAVDLGETGPDNIHGYGLLDALAAFDYLAGQPRISVTDSIPPETDGVVAFSQVAPDDSKSAGIRVHNNGSVLVDLAEVDARQLVQPFTIVNDSCSNRSLLVNQICTIDVRFAPAEAGDFVGSFDIVFAASGLDRVTVELTGTGNTPPVPPTPVAPADGATVGSTVTFSWLPASDADGDAVDQFLVYSAEKDFVLATRLQVAGLEAAMLGGGILLFGGLLAGSIPCRRRRLGLQLLLCGLLLAMVACSGGGGSGDADGEDEADLSAEAQSMTVTDLAPGTTYYWKMLAYDSRGAETESAVWTIVVP